ncbi:MAG: hypothetical protein A3K19_26855 [Lentisphaerae bacterium RIFOXYB12_FULL_65_16]|nr:MAG: hypothetical protein A3K18_23830 [Lentisphaerae bacterium RIFOXYA12_64_32]OGV88019.1 MAG: hypothetical protein A3K19_26855 [Lentisphaerae bacterium RIFOXYB12_FULL_65_16]
MGILIGVAAYVGVLCGTGAAESAVAPDWIAKEKIRAGWIYNGNGVDKVKLFRDCGMNTLVISARDPAAFEPWSIEARRVGMHLFGVLGFSFDAEKAGLRRAVFGNGYESVVACPLDERFWQQAMIEPAVRLAREGMTAEKEVSGVLIDFELYHNADKGGQSYYTDACYCDSCFGGFLKQKGLADSTRDVAYGARVGWLKAKGLFSEYHPWLQRLVRAQAVRMREAVEAVRKDFFLGFYPIPHNWTLVGVAQGLGTPERPMILWATETYGGGGVKKIADDWPEQMRQKEIHCYYCAGVLLRCYSAVNLAAHLTGVALKSNGYWLFTVHTLCVEPSDQKGDYYLASGTRDDYFRELQRANAELDKASATPGYRPELPFVTEPVRYRLTGNEVKRFTVPRLVDRSTVARGAEIAVPPVTMIEGAFVVTVLKQDEDVALKFLTGPGGAPEDCWGVPYTVLDPGKNAVAQGLMPPGQEACVKFKAAVDGVHTVVLSAGHFGRCSVVSTTVPFALWAAKPFEMPHPGGTLYFQVPQGVTSFDIGVRCNFGSTAAHAAVYGPDGAVVQETDTDPLVRSLRLTVETQGRDGQVWSLSTGVAVGKKYRSVFVDVDPKVPPLLTVKPEFVFALEGE